MTPPPWPCASSRQTVGGAHPAPRPTRADDAAMVQRFLSEEGTKVICGGTTAHIFARETQRELQCSFTYVDEKIPPISQIDGVELVTEGIVTMTEALNYFDQQASRSNQADGASLLLNQFLESDDILFLVGTQINPATKTTTCRSPLTCAKPSSKNGACAWKP